jgi:hypothetical protein
MRACREVGVAGLRAAANSHLTLVVFVKTRLPNVCVPGAVVSSAVDFNRGLNERGNADGG